MPVLLYADGRPVKDAEGNPLRTGQTVTDYLLGDCIVRGTVPLDKGEGLNRERRDRLASGSARRTPRSRRAAARNI